MPELSPIIHQMLNDRTKAGQPVALTKPATSSRSRYLEA